METLDLHGKRHSEVDLLVENFVLLNELPVRIITGNSFRMQELVDDVLTRHGLKSDFESSYNMGALIVTEIN